ncbi:MAG: GreA/GreB family elongation factor [Sphingosinicella sp.]|nr:GreA/GreB family elongation factor [Sphingosinicella sp.]
MSVAFRRDSDEEHREPRFELPIPAGPNLVTPSGLARIEARTSELEALVAGKMEETALAEVQRDLRYWRTRLAMAELMPAPPTDLVAFGSRVTFALNGKKRNIVLVGDDEADPAAGMIAFSAPLALMGAAVGDFADFGGEEEAIEILEVDRFYQ